jgi:hypothetical protein
MFPKIVLALAMGASAVSATIYTNHEGTQLYMWNSFKQEYGRQYDAEEDAERFAIFVDNLKVIDERNAAEKEAGGSALHGITKFSDLSQEEFAKRYLTTVIPEGLKESMKKVSLKPPKSGATADWTGTYTTPVKDQGYCGSCWAFSVTEQLESDAMRQLDTDYILAPQQLVSCDTSDSGCNGGWPTTGYEYIESAGGMVQESDYPYTSGTTAQTGSCTGDLSDKVLTVSNYYTLSGESSMAAHMTATGPIAIAVDASAWSSYTGGIMSSCGTSIDHAVQAVGVDTSSYWKVRNSWGSSWGESGYIRLAYGANTCDLAYIPTYVDAATA